MTATIERPRADASEEDARETDITAGLGAAACNFPPVRRYLEDLGIPVHLEGRLPGGHALEESFLLNDLVEHRGQPALICTCPNGRRRRFLLRHLDSVTETTSGRTFYDPEAWFRALLTQH